MNNKLKVANIGMKFGMSHVEGARDFGAEIALLCDSNEANLRFAGERYGIPEDRWITDYKDIIDNYILKAIPEPRAEVSEYAPKIKTIKINPDKIKDVIGSGGKTINKIIEEKADYINKVIEETSKLDDEIRREVVLKRLAKEFDIGYNTLEMRINSLIKNETKQQEINIPKKMVEKKDKYRKAFEQIIYFMLNNDWVISQVENEHLIFPNEVERTLCSEIIYYYKKYGNINVADFYTYIQDKENILNCLNTILAGNYVESTSKEELFLYFKVVREFIMNQEIKRLTNLMKKEIDPLEQAKIVEKIRKLRLGDN
mgnify:CR=1 FL=1